MATLRQFLVVEDDAVTRLFVDAALGPSRHAASASCLRSARKVLPSIDWAGIVLDLSLPDGDGLDLLRELRAKGNTVPVLVLTSGVDRAHINEAQLLGAQYVCKPASRENIDKFIQFAVAHALIDDGDLADRLALVATQYGLTVRESEYVALSARGVERADLAPLLVVSENTVKSQLRALLKKVDATQYSALARLLLVR